MDRGLIGTIWKSPQDNTFEITDLSFDNENIIVYYRNTNNSTTSYSCFFEAFQSRFYRDFQRPMVSIRNSKFGLII